jgi:hypothetical protein
MVNHAMNRDKRQDSGETVIRPNRYINFSKAYGNCRFLFASWFIADNMPGTTSLILVISVKENLMSFKMDRVHVWAIEVKDEPGGVAAKLSRLTDVGANLDYVYTQRSPNKPGYGLLYVAPLLGQEQVKAAKHDGWHEVFDPIVMRVEGDNVAGLAHRLKLEWAKANINLHGAILAVLGTKFLGYVTFDTVEDGNKAARILAELGVQSAPAAAKK